MDQHQASHPSFWSTEQGMAFTSQTQLFKLAHPSVWILAHIPPNKQNHLKVLFFFFPFFILPSFWIFLNHFFLLFKLFLFSNLVVLTNECRILEAVVQSTKATVSCSDSSYLFFLFFGLYPFLYLQALITIAETLTLSTSSPTCCCYKKVARKHQNTRA